MFGKKEVKQVHHRGIMAKLFAELLGGKIEMVIAEENMVIVNCGSYALRYTATGGEILIRKMRNEAYDILLAKNVEKEFKIFSEGEDVFTIRAAIEPKLLSRVEKVLEKTRAEYNAFIDNLKKKRD